VASFGHVAVGMAAARLYAPAGAPRRALARAMVAFAALSLLPDADVVGFAFGVRYGDPLGHRGASHSLAFALALGAVAAARARAGGRPAKRAAIAVALVVASHGLLDALTDGGRGVATLWPLSPRRFFAPWRPIPVAPVGFGVLSPRGVAVLLFEARWFSPCVAYALYPFLFGARRRARGA
jgi:inner membrane protein